MPHGDSIHTINATDISSQNFPPPGVGAELLLDNISSGSVSHVPMSPLSSSQQSPALQNQTLGPTVNPWANLWALHLPHAHDQYISIIGMCMSSLVSLCNAVAD